MPNARPIVVKCVCGHFHNRRQKCRRSGCVCKFGTTDKELHDTMNPSTKVAALFVETNGCYFGVPGVDPWDEQRDARLYAGPYPVVAHPPCQRWGKFWAGQPLHIKRTGERKIKGDDGGCFASALHSVRTYGGVIEHPWGSHAWKHFGIVVPSRSGGWTKADEFSGWTCCVEQGRYGHYARKPTLLYACKTDLPELDWGVGESRLSQELIDRVGIKKAKRLGEVCSKGGGVDSSSRIGTPPRFRDLLLSMGRSVGEACIRRVRLPYAPLENVSA